ncbi:ATP-binding protein [uncultured Cellulomonas sp.]|uniref:sensor histidine kinase n=1 Tax=uncultured Cellulomonas sp. TaxID=189682 RepID=UPI0026197D70|nr:sensor histidine kinase [uncultured Cellulomonas sp.]
MTATPADAGRRPATLRSQLRRALLAAAVALGVLVLCAVTATVQVVRAQDDVTELYYDAITEANDGYVRMLDAETAVRGYALTADPVTLEPYAQALGGSGESTAALADELAADADLFASRERAVEAARRWVVEFAQPTTAAVQTGGTAAVTPAQIERGRVLFDATRDAVETYLDDIRERRTDAIDDLHRWTTILVAATAALALGAAVVGLALWTTLGRWVTRPLAALAADARHVSSGDLGHPVRSTGPGEIAALAVDVETMRQVLVRHVDEAASSTAELGRAHRLLTEQAEELQRSNRDLEQFAYVASHDLQEPLRKVASFTQLLQKRYGGQMDERADQYIEFAVDGAKRMQRLIQDLLGFSRVGRMSGQTVDVDMADALAEAVSNLDEAVAESGATITHGDLPVVRGERPLLVQLLQNLVGNAVKFRAPDRAPQVRVTAWRSDDAWQFECRDNGIGIDEQYAERVFVIFQRLHAKDAYEGTGIGLSLCKKIVEYHGGHIWLEPPDDTPGARIRFSLPITPDPEPAADDAPPSALDAPETTDDRTPAPGR